MESEKHTADVVLPVTPKFFLFSTERAPYGRWPIELAVTFVTGSFRYRLQQLPGFPSPSLYLHSTLPPWQKNYKSTWNRLSSLLPRWVWWTPSRS